MPQQRKGDEVAGRDGGENEVRLDGGAATQRLREIEKQEMVTRRGVLWRAGLAAAAGVGVMKTVDAQQAQAATGGNFLLGEANSAETETALSAQVASTLSSQLMSLDGTNVTATTLFVQGGNHTGINAQSSATTIIGSSSAGTGVSGSSNSGPGVAGQSTTGYALSASGGKAQLFLTPGSSAGAPKSDSHSSGEIYLDSNSTLWQCTVTGTPGTWVRVLTSATDDDSGSTGPQGPAGAQGPQGPAGAQGPATHRLIPSSSSHPPKSGQVGELFVDSSHRLWFCKQGGSRAKWKRIA